MSRIIIPVSLIVIAAAAYWLLLKPETESSAGTPAPQVTEQTQSDAKRHINQITQGSDVAIPITQADNFVTADQLITLPKANTETVATIAAEDASTAAENVTSEDTTTEADGGNATFAVSSHLQIIPSPAKNTQPPNATITSVPLTLEGQIKLQELLDTPETAKNNIYFIHAVAEGDNEGLWGIIQNGLMRTFTAGLNLPGLDKTVSVNIPKEADEKLADKRSSFLGHVLKNKVDQTYIYNYEKGILGDNPDLIKPGQQLVIVTFSEQELIGIYHHFVSL